LILSEILDSDFHWCPPWLQGGLIVRLVLPKLTSMLIPLDCTAQDMVAFLGTLAVMYRAVPILILGPSRITDQAN